ncbi:MAG: hypothetical protein SGJ10_12330 [Bacteroidota bacterium]|nr:hypothetical protein [Bacteroidota bacterium]
MNSFFYTIIFLLFCLSITAQVPGYLGKKNSIGIGAQWFPSYKNYGYTNTSYTPKWDSSFTLSNFRYKSAFNAFYERVIDRHISMNFNYNYQRGGYYSLEEKELIDSAGNITITQSFQGYNVVQHRYELLFKFFFRNSGGLAPLGSYLGVGLNYSIVKGWTVGDEDSTLIKKSLTAMSLTWGKTRILGDHIIIDYGIRCTPFYFNGEVNVINQPVRNLKPASYMFGRNILFAYINFGILI